LLILIVGGCDDNHQRQSHRTTVVEEFTVKILCKFEKANPKLTEKVLEALEKDLRFVNENVPAAAAAAQKQTVIWLEPQTKAVKKSSFSNAAAVYHASAEWLTANGFSPDKAQSVQICHAENYLLWRQHQMVMLHELCHAYHFIIGYDRQDVTDAYEAAKEAGLYEKVGYVLAKKGPLKRAYALTNPHEYFAEISEAYLGRNDYFPFIREDLKKYDANGYELVERLWNLSKEEIKHSPEPRDKSPS